MLGPYHNTKQTVGKLSMHMGGRVNFCVSQSKSELEFVAVLHVMDLDGSLHTHNVYNRN